MLIVISSTIATVVFEYICDIEVEAEEVDVPWIISRSVSLIVKKVIKVTSL